MAVALGKLCFLPTTGEEVRIRQFPLCYSSKHLKQSTCPKVEQGCFLVESAGKPGCVPCLVCSDLWDVT